jgi:hypothetical protein
MPFVTDVQTGLPDGWEPGDDFFEIRDSEFDLASEPSGLIAIVADNDMGYLTLAAAKRLLTALQWAIENAEAVRPDLRDQLADDGDLDPRPLAQQRDDDEIPF